MAEIGRLYVALICICALFIVPGLVSGQEVERAPTEAPDLLDKPGPWEPAKDPATKREERMIWQGCAMKSEMVFYIAQEKIYNHGDTAKLMAYLKEHMNQAELRINEKYMRWLGEWVDSQTYDTAKEFARHMMAECVTNSYDEFQKAPTDRSIQYMQRFEDNLNSLEERLFTGPEVSA